MARKKREDPEEEGSGYNWMDTYGDLVTNLLCFFVMLYAFSSVDSAKWEKIVQAFTGDSGSAPVMAFDIGFAREEAISPVDPMINYENRSEQSDGSNRDKVNIEENEEEARLSGIFDKLYEKLQIFIAENGLEGDMTLIREDDVITIRFGEVFLFESGKAHLKYESLDLLEKIVALIGENVEAIEKVGIQGHTDNVPIHSMEFKSNWELSTARAASTLQKVLEYGAIDPKYLTASGCGEYWPVDTNDTKEGRARNRRVEFVIEKIQFD